MSRSGAKAVSGLSNLSILSDWRKRWNRSLLLFLRRRVRAAVDIEDLAQETYLRLLRARNLQEVRNPQAYLLRVAAHVIMEWRSQNPPAESMLEMDDDFPGDYRMPEFELDESLSQLRLDRILTTLSPMMRAVLILRLRDERPCKEIALDLDITIRQVRRYLARGYERLRGAMVDQK
jgi:RNA polymerase sigma factor (sigma-70 family)